MFEITAYRNRTADYAGTVKDAAGAAVVLAADDVLRLKVYRRNGATPHLDIDSTVTANGSVISIVSAAAGTYVARIAQGDTVNLVPGIYDCELNVVDNSESAPADAIKHVESGVLYLLSTGGGDVGT